MALLDPLFRGLATALRAVDNILAVVQSEREERATARLIRALETGELTAEDPLTDEDVTFTLETDPNPVEDGVDQAVGGIFDTLEDDVVENLEDWARGETSLEDAINAAEGAAVEDVVVALAGSISVDLLGGPLADFQDEAVTQILGFLALEDLLGVRTQATVEDGIGPELRARVNRDFRSKYVDLQDAVEFDLRGKQSDEGYLSDLSTYGIREDQIELLERVALNAIEPEELFEELPQAGVVPSEEAVDVLLQISGMPEALKDQYRELADATPERSDLWEQRTRTGELVRFLDDLVREEEVTPAEAMDFLPADVDEAREPLRARFDLIQALPAGRPSQTEFEDSLTWGQSSPEEFRARLAGSEFPPDQYQDVINTIVLQEADGDMVTAVGMGLMSEATYTELLTEAGLDEDAVLALLQGTDLDDLAIARLTAEGRREGGGLTTIPQIGDQRAQSLRLAGIETVQQLAEADVEAVADALATSRDFAQRLIDAANVRLQ